MKHLRNINEFLDIFGPKEPDPVFPNYTSLAGVSIKDALTEILNNLPQEEIEYYKDTPHEMDVTSPIFDHYKTFIDVDGKRVSLESYGNNLLSTIVIDGYQIGSTTEFRLQRKIFKKLKELKKDLFS